MPGDPASEQRWTTYAFAVVAFSLASFLLLYGLQRLQGVLPFNPTDMPAVTDHVAFNAGVSFMTNTNWQSYGGETTMSHLTQMTGLAVQNFVSAAVGMCVDGGPDQGAGPPARAARSVTSGWTSPAPSSGSCFHCRSC